MCTYQGSAGSRSVLPDRTRGSVGKQPLQVVLQALLLAISHCALWTSAFAEDAASAAAHRVSRLHGGPAGVAFTDRARAGEQLVHVTVGAARAVRSLKCVLNSRALARHGAATGPTYSFRLQSGEYLVGVRGRHGQVVTQLTFISNLRTYGPFGRGRNPDGSRASRRFSMRVPDGYEIGGFTGRASSHINAIGILRRLRTTVDPKGGVNPVTIAPLASPPQRVNESINYTAVATGGSNPTYVWSFGDGTSTGSPQTTGTINHTFTTPGRYTVTVTVTDDQGRVATQSFIQAVHLPLTAQAPAVSQSLVTEPATGRLWNVNPDNDSVSVTVPASGEHTEIDVGSGPRSLAVAPDGRVWVANQKSASISIIDPATLQVVQTLALTRASQPYGLVFDPQGLHAYVALEATGEVQQLAPATGSETGRLAVAGSPRHLAVSADGSRVLVSRFITPPLPGEGGATPATEATDGSPLGGEVLVLATTPAFAVVKTVILQHSELQDTPASAHGVPNYLGPAVISPDGQSAWVPSKQDNIKRGERRNGIGLTFETSVRAVSSHIDLALLSETLAHRIDHDNSGVASTALFHPSGSYLLVALEASREVAVVDPYNRIELFRFATGRAPQGLALASDGLTLYVHNFMDRTITSHDLTALVRTGTAQVVALSTFRTVTTDKLVPQVLLGKQLFYDAKDARLARDGYLSCAACHNEGGHDGRVWDLSNFGEGLRNTISLQGHGGTVQGRLHWTANFDEVQDFEGQIRNFARGTGLMDTTVFTAGTRQEPLGDPKAGLSTDLDALAAYVTSLAKFPPSPYRQANGSLTPQGEVGAILFTGRQCDTCHSGTGLTDSAGDTDVRHDVGTLKVTSGTRANDALNALDTPTLRGVWATAPYLHDGSAATLEDAIAAHRLTGITLDSAEITALARYLEQLEDSTP